MLKIMALIILKIFLQLLGLKLYDCYCLFLLRWSRRFHQFDAKSALLNGYLDEDVYVEQLDSFVITSNKDKV